ncbi:MAG: hypothetical protein ABF629_08585 [Sporolactobacillus sp.]|uniref:hypothetical protein n=1 Tax=Sporolactobacillus sp. STSJ-5 TaxID=2965076 RepID=UPI002107FE7C|nr:hypothetical protein [Sporolactobacillus sp. STSJ-5]MCQ2009495.1 hypothetical protein [Sporolactobacillus sp. STSJ-5]
MDKGKRTFVNACMEAICQCDTSNTHYLFELKTGEHVYRAQPSHLSMYNKDGSLAQLIGMLNPAFIRTYHDYISNHAEHGRIWLHQELQNFLKAFNNKDEEYGF